MQQKKQDKRDTFKPGETADNFTQKASQLNKYQIQSEEFSKQPEFCRKRSILKNKHMSENQLLDSMPSRKKQLDRNTEINKKELRPSNYNLTVTGFDQTSYKTPEQEVVPEEKDDNIK